MKIILRSFLIAILLSFSQMSFSETFIDSASVVSVDKVYKQVRVEEPYKECYIKETVQTGDGSATNEIIGGIIGGAIGNKLAEDSSDTGKDVMTLAGIFLGASIANDAEKAAVEAPFPSNADFSASLAIEAPRKIPASVITSLPVSLLSSASLLPIAPPIMPPIISLVALPSPV